MHIEKLDLINSLEQYSINLLSGDELLKIWENASDELVPIYYNLFHLVSDEDIRMKDENYKVYQMKQLEILIEGLKNNESIDLLKNIVFL